MVIRKSDSQEIREFLLRLARLDWIRRSDRRWWPQFLFHYTDIQNAVSIIIDGFLYCRAFAEDNNKLHVNSGSASVLNGTYAKYKNCVRLYFRPKTPTQFYAEGIKSRQFLSTSRFPDAHCPIMVFFLFNASDVLTKLDCEYSDGNLGSPRARCRSNAIDLEMLPWKNIYHQGPIDRSRSDEIDVVFHRNAEVIVPNELSLESLKYIYCRSTAEKETLVNLLPNSISDAYASKIVSTTRNLLFFRQHTFVESVRLSNESAVFSFSPETKSPGPFQLLLEVHRLNLPTIRLEQEDFNVNANSPFVVRYRNQISKYRIRLTLDGHIAFENTYQEHEIPF